MKINRAILEECKPEIYEEDIDFSKYNFNENHIKSVPFAHAKIEATEYGSTLRIIFYIKAKVIGVCSYSLEDVPLEYEFQDELIFTDEVEESDELIYEKGHIIDLDPHILSLILARVPIKIVKKGAKLPENGNFYRVISEEDYTKEKNNKKDSRWDVLDNVKLDDTDE